MPCICDRICPFLYTSRHPLQELCIDTFVANNTRVKGGHGLSDDVRDRGSSMDRSESSHGPDDTSKSILLLSGANFSGKSVYLKQVYFETSLGGGKALM